MNSKNIYLLQIHNFYRHPGGEEQTMDAEKALLEQNEHTVTQLTADNKDLFKLSARKQFYKRLSHLLTSNSYDIAHIHNVFQIIDSRVFQELNQNKIPIIQTIHNFRYFCINGLFMDNKNENCVLL